MISHENFVLVHFSEVGQMKKLEKREKKKDKGDWRSRDFLFENDTFII